MKTIEVLKKNESKTKSNWRSEAEDRRAKSKWLKYSFAIALSLRHRMNELGVTQVSLAEKLGCTQQHISLLLKGTSNLTLETIAKLEDALDFNILGNALDLVEGYATRSRNDRVTYLSEPTPEYGNKK